MPQADDTVSFSIKLLQPLLHLPLPLPPPPPSALPLATNKLWAIDWLAVTSVILYVIPASYRTVIITLLAPVFVLQLSAPSVMSRPTECVMSRPTEPPGRTGFRREPKDWMMIFQNFVPPTWENSKIFGRQQTQSRKKTRNDQVFFR